VASLISPVVVVLVAEAGAAQLVGTVMSLVSRVTAPPSASARPTTLAPVTKVMEAAARMVPLKVVPVCTVAELPTCQNTQPASAPASRATELPVAVMRVEPAWKMYTPGPVRVTVPVRSIEEVALYTPGIRLSPESSE